MASIKDNLIISLVITAFLRVIHHALIGDGLQDNRLHGFTALPHIYLALNPMMPVVDVHIILMMDRILVA